MKKASIQLNYDHHIEKERFATLLFYMVRILTFSRTHAYVCAHLGSLGVYISA